LDRRWEKTEEKRLILTAPSGKNVLLVGTAGCTQLGFAREFPLSPLSEAGFAAGCKTSLGFEAVAR
jgi:hypothetical protein